jgi:hypothetical protein
LEGGSIYDLSIREPLARGGVSSRPLHDLATRSEHVSIGAMLHALNRARRIVYELKTDSRLYKPPARRRKSLLEDTRYSDLHLLRDRFEGKTRRLDDYSPIISSDATGTVYRTQAQPRTTC